MEEELDTNAFYQGKLRVIPIDVNKKGVEEQFRTIFSRLIKVINSEIRPGQIDEYYNRSTILFPNLLKMNPNTMACAWILKAINVDDKSLAENILNLAQSLQEAVKSDPGTLIAHQADILRYYRAIIN